MPTVKEPAPARVLYMQLHNAEEAVGDLRELRDWAEMITDWDAYAETWAQYRDPTRKRAQHESLREGSPPPSGASPA